MPLKLFERGVNSPTEPILSDVTSSLFHLTETDVNVMLPSPNDIVQLDCRQQPFWIQNSSKAGIYINPNIDFYPTHLPPIFMLPPEILADIFCINEMEYEHENAKSPRFASQVCRHWRETAFECHTLWASVTNLNRSSLQWIEELLRRSKGSPLVVKGFIKDEKAVISKLLSIMEHISRFEVFQIVVLSCSSVIDDAVWQLLSHPTPFLRSFHIIDQSGLLFDSIAPTIPDLLFNKEAPLLCDLRIRNVPLDFTLPLLHGLTRLEVDTVSHNLAPVVGKWLEILGNMMSLEYLTIVDAFCESKETEIYFAAVHLPRLYSINLTGSFSKCVCLLDHLILPPACSLGLSCSNSGIRKLADVGIMEKIITRSLNSWPTDTISTSMELYMLPDFIYVSNDPNCGWKPLHPIKPTFELSLLCTETHEETHLISSVLRALEAAHPPNILELHLDISSNLCDQLRPAFLNFMSLFSAVEVLKLPSRALRKLLPMIQNNSVAATKDGSLGSTPPPLILPSLRCITLDIVLCGEETRTYLFSFLQWRSDVGAGIDAVDITTCCANEKLSDGLKKIAGLTIIDGTSNDSQTEDSDGSSVASSPSASASTTSSTS